MASLKTVEARGVRLSTVVMRASARAVCPLTGITDIYEVVVEYKPKGERYIEAYSFEEFLRSFENRRIYQEELTQLVAREVCGTGAAEKVRVTVRGTHGGTELTTVVEMGCGD